MIDQRPISRHEQVLHLHTGLRLPLIGAPMFLASGIDLVVAQCTAGIIGTFPALNARPAAQLDDWLTQIRARLDAYRRESGITPAPFGVNLIVNDYNTRLDEDLATIVRHRVPLVITSLSAPDKVVEAVHGYGGLVFHDVVKGPPCAPRGRGGGRRIDPCLRGRGRACRVAEPICADRGGACLL